MGRRLVGRELVLAAEAEWSTKKVCVANVNGVLFRDTYIDIQHHRKLCTRLFFRQIAKVHTCAPRCAFLRSPHVELGHKFVSARAGLSDALATNATAADLECA